MQGKNDRGESNHWNEIGEVRRDTALERRKTYESESGTLGLLLTTKLEAIQIALSNLIGWNIYE